MNPPAGNPIRPRPAGAHVVPRGNDGTLGSSVPCWWPTSPSGTSVGPETPRKTPIESLRAGAEIVSGGISLAGGSPSDAKRVLIARNALWRKLRAYS